MLLGARLALSQERPWSEKPIFGEDVGGEVWKEGGYQLPDFPQDESLRLLDLEYLAPRFTFYIDTDSLSVGQDAVLRYTVVIESQSGKRTVYFEGVRCETGEYKTYAYGTRKQTFQSFKQPRWKLWDKAPRTGANGYRRSLSEIYLCDPYAHVPVVAQVKRRLGSSTTRRYEAAFPNALDEGPQTR